MTMRAVHFIALLFLAPTSGFACHRMYPETDALESYRAVFVGTVTSVHEVGLENRLTGKPDHVFDGIPLQIKDGSSPVAIRVVSQQKISGKPRRLEKLDLAGCTFNTPPPGTRGIFFVHRRSRTAIAVWESEPEEFSTIVRELGIDLDDD